MPDRLGLSFSSVSELNTIIDKHLPGRPKFYPSYVDIGGERHEWYLRDIIPCLRALFGNPEFADHLLFQPELHFKDNTRSVRIYAEMNTGKWWWSAQVCFIFAFYMSFY